MPDPLAMSRRGGWISGAAAHVLSSFRLERELHAQAASAAQAGEGAKLPPPPTTITTPSPSLLFLASSESWRRGRL